MIRQWLVAVAFAAVGVTAANAAGDDALYDPAPPANSAFVRVIDARGEGNLQVTVGNAAVTVPASGVSPYVVVPQGPQDVVLSTATSKVTLAAGKYYTIALFVGGASEPTLLEDAILANPAKSGIYVYNFSDAPSIKLFAPKPKVAVVDGLQPGASMFKSVNAVTVDLALMDGDKTLAEFDALDLKRRAGVTFVAFGAGDAKKGVMVANQTAR
jgi:alginate O-acetyltransferase complex protein AlgF